jgi:superfamily I DNA/RNA helicase
VLPAHGRDEPPVAILARTNAELVPYAAVALERDLPYAVDDDGLLLDDPWVDRLLDAAEELTSHARGLPLLVALGRARASAPRAARLVAAALLAWAPRYADLATFRAGIADARVRRATLRETTPLVTLATAHGTKGLEFDRVVCVGLDEGRFPSARTLAEADEPARVMEEERRLAYVAWTRARSRLVLVYDPEAPSPFMTEAFDADELRPPRRGDARQRQSGMRRSTA